MNKLLALFTLGLTLVLASAAPAPRAQVASSQEQNAQDRGALRFTHVDVFVDSGASALGAWQARLVDSTGRAAIVGVEGGADGAFAEPPYYDPAALQGGAIVLAAFHTGGAGPAGKTRVARVHLAVRGAAPIDFNSTLEVAASDAGHLPHATLTLGR